MGFCDPCPGEPKQLYIEYTYGGNKYEVKPKSSSISFHYIYLMTRITFVCNRLLLMTMRSW